MRHRTLTLLSAIAVAIAWSEGSPAEAVPAGALDTGVSGPVVIDRIVAVVEDDIITSSDVERRAKPFLEQVAKQGPVKAAEARRGIYKEVLERVLDEHAIAEEADELQVAVSPDEVERGIESVKAASSMTQVELENSVEAAGLTWADYKVEIRRQLLEGKLMNLQVVPALKREDGEDLTKKLEAARPAWISGLRAKIYIDLRSEK